MLDFVVKSILLQLFSETKMVVSKQNSTESSVTVTLRIPLNIYHDVKTVADEYEVSIPVAFRIYLKQLRDCYNNSQQTKSNRIQHNNVSSNNPGHNNVSSNNSRQPLTEQAKQKILDDWGGDDEA